jgi:hypothetical protein
MSLIGTVANYGGKQPTNKSYIKQFVISGTSTEAIWYYKRLTNGLVVQTPADNKYPVYIANDLYVTGSIFNTSDLKLKDNIDSINIDKTNELLNLNPVSFTFKSDIEKKIHYGLIAQEIEKIYPELVGNNNLGYKTVNYIEIIPLLLSKMKIMQNEIDELKTKLQTLNLDNK